MSADLHAPTVVTNRAAALFEEKFDAREKQWYRWVLLTARRWHDIAGLIKLTGIENIDEDHRRLTEISLGLSDILGQVAKRRISIDEIGIEKKALDNLYAFTSFHFRREERIIALYGLPNEARQKRQHQIFLETLKQHIEEFAEGKLTASFGLKGWILEWWVNHINQLDHDTFQSSNWTDAVISRAVAWDDVSEIIRRLRIDSLDAQHRRMTELTLNLLADTDRHADAQTLAVDLKSLIDCADEHFREEESLIERHGLPFLDEQQRQHTAFLDVIRSYQHRCVGGNEPTRKEIHGFLLSWWINHINNADANSFAPSALASTVFLAAESWNDFSPFIRAIGNERIDEDHQAISLLIIRLKELARADADTNLILSGLDEILSVVTAHFEHEEGIIRDQGALLGRLHLDDHAHFLAMLRNCREDLAFGRLKLTENLRRVLLDWWSNHINSFDYHTFGAEDRA